MHWIIIALVAYLGSTVLTLCLIHQQLTRMRAEVRELVAEMLRESIRQAPQQALDKATEMAGAVVERMRANRSTQQPTAGVRQEDAQESRLISGLMDKARGVFGAAGERRQ